tara:strand:- start:105 stop:302 length:198 start_codon:yes stop_codon:yes gene_type:complete
MYLNHQKYQIQRNPSNRLANLTQLHHFIKTLSHIAGPTMNTLDLPHVKNAIMRSIKVGIIHIIAA